LVAHRKSRIPKEPWQVPCLWPHSTVFILGGGPSINQVDLNLIHNKNVIGVNNSYGHPIGKGKYIPRDWVDICYFGDGRWWKWHKDNLKKFQGIICSSDGNMQVVDTVRWVKRGDHSIGIETKNGYIAWNRCSGLSAINLAYHLGAKRVILLGFDMKAVDGKNNWHDDHPVHRSRNNYLKYLSIIPDIKRDADKLGLEILNATKDSAIIDFEKVNIEDVL